MVWSGSRLACLPLLSFVSHFWKLPPRLGASRVSGQLVVSHFFPKQFTVRGSQFFLKMCPPFVSLPFSANHVTVLFICLPGLSLVSSALFCWPCSISIHLSPRSVSAGVRPCLAGHVAFLFVCLPVLHCWCPPFSVGHVAFLFIVSQVCHWRCPPFSVGHAAFLFICLPGLSLVVSALVVVLASWSSVFKQPHSLPPLAADNIGKSMKTLWNTWLCCESAYDLCVDDEDITVVRPSAHSLYRCGWKPTRLQGVRSVDLWPCCSVSFWNTSCWSRFAE